RDVDHRSWLRVEDRRPWVDANHLDLVAGIERERLATRGRGEPARSATDDRNIGMRPPASDLLRDRDSAQVPQVDHRQGRLALTRMPVDHLPRPGRNLACPDVCDPVDLGPAVPPVARETK